MKYHSLRTEIPIPKITGRQCKFLQNLRVEISWEHFKTSHCALQALAPSRLQLTDNEEF